MRFLKVSLITVMVTLFFFASFSIAADTKVGVFNFEQVMKKSKKGKAAEAKIQKRHKSLKAQLQKKKNELEAMDAKLQKDAAVMGKEKFAEKRYELQKKAIDFQQFERKSTDEIRKMQQQLVTDLNKDIVKVLNKIGKKEKFDIIMEKNMAGVAFYTTKVDLTNIIVKELNN